MKGTIRQVYVEIELENRGFILIPRPAVEGEIIWDGNLNVESKDSGFSFQIVEENS